MIPDYTGLNRGLERKLNKAWRSDQETIELNVQFLRDVSHALDDLVKASKRRAVQCGSTWRIAKNNADKYFRNASDEEIARRLSTLTGCPINTAMETCPEGHHPSEECSAYTCWLDWLRKEEW